MVDAVPMEPLGQPNATYIKPDAGKSHFFAMYSVVGSLTLGVFPFLWGMLIDSLDGVEIMRFGLSWNQYSISFALLIGVLTLLFVLVLGTRGPNSTNSSASGMRIPSSKAATKVEAKQGSLKCKPICLCYLNYCLIFIIWR